ncbi:MAG: HK97 gp10 family phage protein, partial [bacterium]
MAAPGIVFQGLPELRRRLRAVDSALPRAVGQIFKIAADKVASDARSTIPSRTGRLAGSVRPFGTGKRVGVRMGRASVPYAGPVEFGGYPGGRPFIQEGRYILPAF